MRSTFLLAAAAAAAAPAFVAAAPPSPPHITSLRISGSGCPNDSGSVKATSSDLGDSASFTFGQLRGDSTDNCEIHVQSSGASQGWQVAVKAVAYQGNLQLKPGSSLDTFTTVFWSENASDTSTLTGHIACAGPEIRDSFTLKQSTSDLAWSKCTGSDGYPGTLNVNARPVIQGNSGTYDIRNTTWNFEWRKC